MLDQKVFVPQLERISLKKVLTDVISIMQGQARLRAIRIALKFTGKDIVLQIDQMRTIQILLNLISNAIKFSPEDSVIHLETSYHMLEAGVFQVRITVVD